MELIEVLAIITFIVLLLSSIYMLIDFYVCDSQNCKIFKQAGKTAEPGTKQYVLTLLRELYYDGIWPFPYIGAAILTPLSLWFIRVPITVLNFAIVFFTSFVTIYFLFSFFGHHYIRYVATYTYDYIDENCPDALSKKRKLPVYEEEEEDEPLICFKSFEPYNGDLNVTFASNIDIYQNHMMSII